MDMAQTDLTQTIDQASIILFWVLVLVAVILLILAMIAYFTAYGDPEVAKKGTSRVLYAAATLAVAILSRVLLSIF